MSQQCRYRLTYQAGRHQIDNVFYAYSDKEARVRALGIKHVPWTMTIYRWDTGYAGWLPIDATDAPRAVVGGVAQYRVTLTSADKRVNSLEQTPFPSDDVARRYAEQSAAMMASRHQQHFVSKVQRYADNAWVDVQKIDVRS